MLTSLSFWTLSIQPLGTGPQSVHFPGARGARAAKGGGDGATGGGRGRAGRFRWCRGSSGDHERLLKSLLGSRDRAMMCNESQALHPNSWNTMFLHLISSKSF